METTNNETGTNETGTNNETTTSSMIKKKELELLGEKLENFKE